MKINRESWHYKLQDAFFSYKTSDGQIDASKEPRNLCSYFWATAAAIMLTSILTVLLVIIVCEILFMAALVGYAAYFAVTHVPHVVTGQFALYALTVVAAIIGLFTICWLVYVLSSKIKRSDTANLFREYVKAKKQKMCPIIEYEN